MLDRPSPFAMKLLAMYKSLWAWKKRSGIVPSPEKKEAGTYQTTS
jgi:hypothetical protein